MIKRVSMKNGGYLWIKKWGGRYHPCTSYLNALLVISSPSIHSWYSQEVLKALFEQSKFKITEREEKTVNSRQLKTLERGTQFHYGGRQWTALEHDDGGGTLCITTELTGHSAFGDDGNADWRQSSLRAVLNDIKGGFFADLRKSVGHMSDFLPITSNLTADNGQTDYGTSEDYIALLSCDLYRKHREAIPPVGDWWWTLTPCATSSRSSRSARCVNSDGDLFNGAAFNGIGVRPLCRLESEILVSTDAAPDADTAAEMGLNQLAAEIHQNAVEKGWWDGNGGKSFPEILMLCVSELSEALEAFRDGEPDFYMTEAGIPTGTNVELADCMIRILDYCGSQEIDIEAIIRTKHEYNKTRPYRHGGKKI